MELIDTHCHIHDPQFYESDREAVFARARDAHVKMICIGTSEQDSKEAVKFASKNNDVWAVVGVHPHDTKDGWKAIEILLKSHNDIVGIGEIGLDYFYDNSPREVQLRALEEQLQWASDYHLPVSFHVREAFDDFWPVLSNFSGIRGVLHSFTDNKETLETALAKGLYIGVNGISTFARDKSSMWDEIPLERFLLETDAPFLTPVPLRGKVNEPAFVRHVAEYHAKRRRVELEEFALTTSANATTLFQLEQ
jgi:TatD DNase family protein